MKLLHTVGARPNFMKAAPVMAALAQRPVVCQTLVHTGQHYDASMSEIFFRQLGLPEPDINLAVGSGSHAQQTAQIMACFEPVLLEQKPDLVLVYGDVNSTVAAALVCAKLLVPLGHVEAGLRSFDRTMPEEINRLLTDQIADLLFIPSAGAGENLRREGIEPGKIHLVGNVMIDTLVRLLPVAQAGWQTGALAPWPGQRYALVTLHRPSNVDDAAPLSEIMKALADISQDIAVLFPVHPRTRQRILELSLPPLPPTLQLVEPLGYLDFLALQHRATLVITDSGGIQEETTFLGVPCLTVRENTERPITVEMGTNILVGQDMRRLRAEVGRILTGKAKQGRVPPLWDGRTAERVAEIITKDRSMI
jgi:UDP-N-acetylglucosamine 2-epimerase (non-hydrolysing)